MKTSSEQSRKQFIRRFGTVASLQVEKSIEVRFNTETAAQHFVDGEIHINGSSYAFRRNAQRRLRVSILGCTLTSLMALEYELLHYFGGVLEIKRTPNSIKQRYTRREQGLLQSQNYTSTSQDRAV